MLARDEAITFSYLGKTFIYDQNVSWVSPKLCSNDQVPMSLLLSSTAMSLVQSGKLDAIAVTSAKRSPLTPTLKYKRPRQTSRERTINVRSETTATRAE